MALQSKQVNKLIGNFYRVSEYQIPAVGCGISDSALTLAINTLLGTIPELPSGYMIANKVSSGNAETGIPCVFDLALEIRNHETQDTLEDSVNEAEVAQIVSHKAYSAGLAITGIAIDFVSNGCTANGTSNMLSYDQSANTLAFSSNAGSTYGTPVVVPATTNACIILKDALEEKYIFVRKTAAALPGADEVDDAITVIDTNWALGFISWVAGARKPYYNSELIEVDFIVPVILQWSCLTPDKMLIDMGIGFLDAVTSAEEKFIVEPLTITPPATLTGLSAVPRTANKITLEVNGHDLTYGASGSADFDISGQTITVYPTHLGYELETTDDVIVKYWRI